ncbi:MAG: deoxyribonuclease IV [bacterium]
MKYQQAGLHISAAGGVESAPERARELGAECFQFFSRSPRGGAAPDITDGQAGLFRSRCREYGLESYVHTPYYINFASKNKDLAAAAPRIVQEELKRGSLLGVRYVVTHVGSAVGRAENSKLKAQSPNAALRQAAGGLKSIYEGQQQFAAKLLLEIAAGSGQIIGHTFEELAYLLKELGRKDVHVCLDTCHMFASGYDIRDATAVNDTMRQFKRLVGTTHLKLVHVNDSKVDLGERKDFHEHIGKGKIGEHGIRAVLNHKDFQRVNFVLETKHDRLIKEDLDFLKKWRRIK